MSEHLPFRFTNAGFGLRRLAEDCAPHQELRELVQNGIDAIDAHRAIAPTFQGTVTVDVDWELHADTGRWKLAVTDDGIGMTEPELVDYINQGFSSTSEQSFDGHFGIGAKITAGVRNPAGVNYLSWRDGTGAMVRFAYFPDSDEYGLAGFELPDGTFRHVTPVTDDVRPDLIGGHGTKVTLFGDGDDANTVACPANWSGSRSRWLLQYLTHRWYRLPDHVTVKVRQFRSADPEDWPHEPTSSMELGGQLTEVEGMGPLLDRVAEASDTAFVDGAAIHWWIMPEGRNPDTLRARGVSKGHVAAVFDNELYDLRRDAAGIRMLQRFGIVGTDRVVLYVEPDPDLGARPDTARSTLKVVGEPLPYSAWASQFAHHLPGPLQELHRRLLDDDQDRRDLTNRRRIQDVWPLLSRRWRRTPTGPDRVDADDHLPGGTPAPAGQTHDGTSTTGGDGGRRDDLYARAARTGADEAATPLRPSRPEPPTTQWLSAAQGDLPDDMVGRAARYIAETDLLLLNEDWIGFTSIRDQLLEECGPGDQVDVAVSAMCREWLALPVLEVVVAIRAQARSRHWRDDQVEAALSDEALTAAAAPKWLMLRHLRTELAAIRRRSANAA